MIFSAAMYVICCFPFGFKESLVFKRDSNILIIKPESSMLFQKFVKEVIVDILSFLSLYLFSVSLLGCSDILDKEEENQRVFYKRGD